MVEPLYDCGRMKLKGKALTDNLPEKMCINPPVICIEPFGEVQTIIGSNHLSMPYSV
jgi:hypothetical protein